MDIDSLKKLFRSDMTSVIYNPKESESSIEVTTPKMLALNTSLELVERESLEIKGEIKSRNLSLDYFSSDEGKIRASVYEIPIGYLGATFQSIPKYKGFVKVVKDEYIEIDILEALSFKDVVKAKQLRFEKDFKENLRTAIGRGLIPKDTQIKKNEDMKTGQISYHLSF